MTIHRYANGKVTVLRILHSSQDVTVFFGSTNEGDQTFGSAPA